MSGPAADHPSPERLPAFGLGLLSAEESAVIERHVAECDVCAQSLLTVADDALVSRLRQAASTSGAGEAPTQGLSAGATAAPEPLPPELAAHPRYRVEQLLGAGGMGAVYRAFHRVMGRPVALKVISHALTNKPAAVERFAREGRAAARLTHPNIVTAFDAEQAGGTHFLVMEYVEGTDLARLVAEQGPLPVDRACEYVRQAALGLQHAFEQGMVHRDVKPHNLMLTPEGQVKILDFGLARFASEAASEAGITGTGTVLGTVDYIAPEQADNAHQADVRSDIYSLGCTLYHLLAGHAPFPTGTPVQRVMAHVEKTPQPLAELRPDIPEELMPVLERMMAKSPAARYRTPAEVTEALRPFTDPAALRAFRKASPAARPAPRRGALVAAALALLLLGGGLLGAVVYRIATDKGELVIESDSDEVEVTVSQGGRVVKIVDTTSGKHVTLRPGDYELALKGRPEGLKLSADKVTLRRGEKVLATIRRVAPAGPAVQPRPNGPLVFQDNFDTPAPLAAPLFGRDLMSFEHVKGAGMLVPRKHGVVPAMYAKPKVADFYAEVDIRVPSPTSDSGYGLLFRSTDVVAGQLDGYYGLWVYPGRGSLALVGWQGPKWAVGKKYPLKPGAFSARKANRLRLEVVGGEFRVFLNGDFVCRFTDSLRAGPGLLGLGVGDGSNEAEAVYFSRLRVYAPEPTAEKAGEVRRFEGHRGGVIGISYAPDGRHVLSTSYDRTVRLWDVASGKELRRFEGHTAWPYHAVLSPDGRFVLSGGDDFVLRIWDAKTGKELRRGEGHTKGITWVAASPDSRRALTASWDGTVRLWNVETGEQLHVLEGHTEVVESVAFSPDGKRALSAGGDKTIRLWDLEAGKELRRLEGHTEMVMSAAFSPDGRRALSGGLDKTIRLWDVDTGKQVRCIEGHTSPVFQVAFAPDGRRAVSAASPEGDEAGERGVRGWDLETGKELYRLETRVAGRMAASPDGRYALVSAPEHPDPRLWRLPEPPAPEKVGQVHLFTGHRDIVHGLAVSPDGHYAVSGGGYKLREGQLVVGAKDYDVRLWDLTTRTEVRRLPGSGAAVYSLAFAPDGRRVLSGGGNPAGAIRLLEVATGKELWRSAEREHAVWSVAFSPDGRRALDAADLDNEFRLWEAESGKEVRRFAGHTAAVRRAVFSPDGRRALSCSADGTARLWDVETGRELKRFEGHEGWVHNGAFSPDGRRVLTAGHDHTARLWDVESGQEVRRLEGHKARVSSVAFSPDGRFALSAGGGSDAEDEEDFSLRLWDLESGKELHRFEGHTDVVSQVLWLPDGRHALSSSWDTTVRLWRLPDLPPAQP